MPGIGNDTFPKKVKPTVFKIIVVELSKGSDTKAKYDGQRAVPVKFKFKGSSNMVSGNDSAKKGTQLTLIGESYINTGIKSFSESEHQVLNDSHIFVSFTGILLLFGTKFQYSCKRRQDEEGKQSDEAAIRDLVLTFCPTMRSVQQRKLKLLMLV